MQYCAWEDHYHTSLMKPVRTGHYLSWCGLPGLELFSVYPFISVMGHFAVLRVILARHSDEIVSSSFSTLLEKGDSIGTTGTV